MCGRYFWNDDAEDEFLEDFPDLAGVVMRLRAGDYTPGMSAPAIAADFSGIAGAAGAAESAESAGGVENARSGSGVCMEPLLWGFPGFDKGRLLINARAESVKDRPTFADSFAGRRCALPAAGFYEWDKANASMEPVHDRMPLILTGDEVLPWVSDAAKAGDILTKELPMLKAERPYEQISFEFE